MDISILQRSKAKRLLTSPSSFILAFLAILISLSNGGKNITFSLGTVIVVLAIMVLIVQSWLEYKKRTYDPSLALKYFENFENKKEERKIAAQTILNRKEELSKIDEIKDLSNIDDVLDLFEDLGFYIRGDQMSPEVAHHFFYHWIRGYWVFCEPYIRAWRNREKTRWEYIEELFEVTCEIEIKRGGTTRKEEFNIPKQDKFLEEEIQD